MKEKREIQQVMSKFIETRCELWGLESPEGSTYTIIVAQGEAAGSFIWSITYKRPSQMHPNAKLPDLRRTSTACAQKIP